MHLAAEQSCCVKPLCQGVEAMWWLRLMMRLDVGSHWGWGYPILEHRSRVASACFLIPMLSKHQRRWIFSELQFVMCILWSCPWLININITWRLDTSLSYNWQLATDVLFCFEFRTSAPSEASWTPPNFRWTSLMLQRPGRRIHKMRTSPLHNARDGQCVPHVHDPNELASAPAPRHA